ncbi:MAG TPA: hypothetical protein PKA64_04455 [Myxococcota bacterium]|nr:hypothetical protein [Myxococcota bacterium]
MGVLWWAILTGAAFAQSFYIESAPAATREPALEVARLAAAAGVDGRVVRLYAEGSGWRYVFRSEERPEDAELLDGLRAIRAGTAVTVQLVRLDGGKAQVIESGGAPHPEPVVPMDRTLDAQEVLRRVVRAHAGPAPADRLDAAAAVVFRFERTLEDRRVSHLYVRRGEDRYLQVEILSGKGAGSRLGVVGGKAWMEGAEAGELDPLRVREQIERFSPERVLSLPLGFAGGLPGGRELSLMTVGDAHTRDGHPTLDLVWDGDRQSSPLKIVVDQETWRILEVDWGTDDDAVRWSFGAYAELGDGAIYPGSVEVQRSSHLIDRVEVGELDLEPALLPEWFTPP